MDNEQFAKLKSKINCEIDLYRKNMLENSKEEIFDSSYEINAYEQIHDHFLNCGRDYDYKYLPKKNIIRYFYNKFINSEMKLTDEDLNFLIEIDKFKKIDSEKSEM